MQLSFKKGKKGLMPRRRLADLRRGQEGVLEHIDLPDELKNRLMLLGFVPGEKVTAGHSAPGGDPRVFRIDGTEIALRRETAQHLWIGASPPEVS